MKNILNILKRYILPVAAIVPGFLVLFIPVPALIMEILTGIEVLCAILIFVYALKKHSKLMSVLVLLFALFSFSLNIGFTRIVLNGYMGGQRIPFADFIFAVSGGKNYLLAIVISILLITLQIILVTRGCCRLAEVAAKFALDSMNSKMFDIDYRLNQKLIDETESKKLKTALMAEAYFCSRMDGSARFLSGVGKANLCGFLANLICGVLIQMQRQDAPFDLALKNSIVNTSVSVIIFVVPLLIVSFAIVLAMQEKNKTGI